MTQLSSDSILTDKTTINTRRFQIIFFAIAVFFNLCLVAQLLTVGLAVFSSSPWWQVHIWLVRSYGGLAILLLVGAFLLPFQKRIRALTKGIVILLTLQFVTAHVHQPFPLGILHPLLGFSLFTVSTTLVHRTLPEHITLTQRLE